MANVAVVGPHVSATENEFKDQQKLTVKLPDIQAVAWNISDEDMIAAFTYFATSMGTWTAEDWAKIYELFKFNGLDPLELRRYILYKIYQMDPAKRASVLTAIILCCCMFYLRGPKWEEAVKRMSPEGAAFLAKQETILGNLFTRSRGNAVSTKQLNPGRLPACFPDIFLLISIKLDSKFLTSAIWLPKQLAWVGAAALIPRTPEWAATFMAYKAFCNSFDGVVNAKKYTTDEKKKEFQSKAKNFADTAYNSPIFDDKNREALLKKYGIVPIATKITEDLTTFSYKQ